MRQLSRVARGAVAVGLVLHASSSFAAQCGFRHAFDRPDEGGTTVVRVFRGSPVPALDDARPLLFIASLKVNTDGTTISYNERDPTGAGARPIRRRRPARSTTSATLPRSRRPEAAFAAVRDAGYPVARTWQILSPNIIERDARTGKPCITPDGYLVSMTADVAVEGGRQRVGDCDQSKWIDALTAPAIVLPRKSQFLDLGLGQRSLVVAVSRSATRRVVPGIVGDSARPPRSERPASR